MESIRTTAIQSFESSNSPPFNPIPIVHQRKMSTTSSSRSSAVTAKATLRAEVDALLEGRDMAFIVMIQTRAADIINKQALKKTRAKREPTLDEDGNVVKRPLPEGAKVWNSNVAQFKEMLTEYLKNEATENGTDPDSIKVSHKACMRVCSILKEKAEALGTDEENTFYPVDNLTTEVMAEEWEAWSTLPDEEKFPKKEKKAGKKSPSASASASAAEDSEAEPEVAKPKRGRPAKKVAAPADSEAEEAPKAKKTPAKKAAVPVDSEAEAEAPKAKKTPAKKAAAVVDSEAEAEPKPVKKATKGKKAAAVEEE